MKLNIWDLMKDLGGAGIVYEKEYPDFRVLAIDMHGNQRYGSRPYAFHLAQVEAWLNEYNYNEFEYQAAAWLHDTVEDCRGVTPARLSSIFGETVAGIVWACTGEGKNRKERQESIYVKLKKYPTAAPVKLADRICNMYHSSLESPEKLTMYLGEWETFKENVKPLMQSDRRDSRMWNDAESVVERLKDEFERKNKLQQESE